jgi:hypothetical protein
MAHHTNLTMQTLFEIPIVKHIEDFLPSFFIFYFGHSSKMHLDFFANFMKTKGNKILWNVKTH